MWIKIRRWGASLGQRAAEGVRRTSATLRGSPRPAAGAGAFRQGRRPGPVRPGRSMVGEEAVLGVLALLRLGATKGLRHRTAARPRRVALRCRPCPLVL